MGHFGSKTPKDKNHCFQYSNPITYSEVLFVSPTFSPTVFQWLQVGLIPKKVNQMIPLSDYTCDIPKCFGDSDNKTFANNAGTDAVGIRATRATLPPGRGHEGSQP